MTFRFFPFHERLNQKWWHRLSKVLIVAIVCIAFLISILATWAAFNENKIKHAIYNFESGYLSNAGEEQLLNKYNATRNFLDRLIIASKDRDSEDREFVPKPDTEEWVSEGIGDTIFKSKSEMQRAVLEGLEDGKLNQTTYKIKIWHEYSYFPEILWLLICPIVYLLFIGFYGVILYIAYGANPFKR